MTNNLSGTTKFNRSQHPISYIPLWLCGHSERLNGLKSPYRLVSMPKVRERAARFSVKTRLRVGQGLPPFAGRQNYSPMSDRLANEYLDHLHNFYCFSFGYPFYKMGWGTTNNKLSK